MAPCPPPGAGIGSAALYCRSATAARPAHSVQDRGQIERPVAPVVVQNLAPSEGAAPEAGPAHLRRCTFRRVMAVARKPLPVYDVECLFPGRTTPIPLGDLETARPICENCRAVGIFRADED